MPRLLVSKWRPAQCTPLPKKLNKGPKNTPNSLIFAWKSSGLKFWTNIMPDLQKPGWLGEEIQALPNCLKNGWTWSNIESHIRGDQLDLLGPSEMTRGTWDGSQNSSLDILWSPNLVFGGLRWFWGIFRYLQPKLAWPQKWKECTSTFQNAI